MNRPTAWPKAWPKALVLLALAASVARAWAAPDPSLPEEGSVLAALRAAPLLQASAQALQAEHALHRQWQASPHEWVGSVSAGRRQQRGPVQDHTQEWELGLERTLRSAPKAQAHDQAGARRVALAQAQRSQVWREQARNLLALHAQWLREHAALRVLDDHSALLQAQRDAVQRRLALGDAAQVDAQLAHAAWLQVHAQAQATRRRADEALNLLQRSHPGLLLPATPPLPTQAPLPGTEDAWQAAQLAADPALQLARSEMDAVQALAVVAQREQRPDPTLGLRAGMARNGEERFVGLTLSLPFGGAHRQAAAQVASAQASSAALRWAAAERQAQVDAAQRWRALQSAQALWADQAAAAQQLTQVADALQRGYRLGEGQLAEVAQARRQALEQQLATAASAVDAWLARQRLVLEAGQLWAEPPSGP